MNRIPIIIQGGGVINQSSDDSTVLYSLKYDASTNELILEKDGVEDNRINITPDNGNLKLILVTALPTENIREDAIYLIEDNSEEDNIYSEYIYVNGNWERFGSANIDVSGISSELEDDLNVSKDVGGVISGTNYPKGTTLEEILRDVLNPLENPRLTAPSATLSIQDGTLFEKGTTANITINISFNRGSISPSYGTSGYRSGEAVSYALNNGAEQTNSTFSTNVSETNNTFVGTVKYNEGEQPKNSAGENYDNALQAGQISTNTVTCEFVDPIWSNAADITAITKETLVSKSAKSKIFEFPAQTLSDVETFDISVDWEVTDIQVLNQLSNKYEDCASEFTVSDVTHGSTQYKRYSDNRGYEAGPRTIKVLWK